MAVVGIRNPVVALHPITGQYITLSRGGEFDDDDPIVREYSWAFVDEPAPEPVKSTPVEAATRAPGERRNLRRG